MDNQIDKATFVGIIGVVLRAAGVGVSRVELNDEDTVEIIYKSGLTRFVDIARDSRMEILADIIHAVR